LVVGLKSWRSRERSCVRRAWSSSGRKQVAYKPDLAVGRVWSNLVGECGQWGRSSRSDRQCDRSSDETPTVLSLNDYRPPSV